MPVDSPDIQALQATVHTLEQEVQELRALVTGSTGTLRGRLTVVPLYWDAVQGQVSYSETEAKLWEHLVLSLTHTTLLSLARTTRDPFPWRAFLLVLDGFTARGYPLNNATAHIQQLARNMLDSLGLWKLDIGDLFNAPYPTMKSTLSSYK